MRSVDLRSIAMLLLGLAAPTAAAFGPPQLAYRSGNVRMAASALQEALTESPDDADLHARMGITLAMMGDYSDALPHFQFALGSAVYEAEAWDEHADTLRAMGRGGEAYAMRAERLAQLPREAGEAALRCDMIDDLRAMGELDAALEMAELTLTLHPYSNVARAIRLEVALDRGDPDADALLAWMQRDAVQSTRSLRVQVRMAQEEGDIPEALALLERLPRQSRTYAPFVALEAELLRLAQEPEEALWVLDRPMVRTPDHPALLAVRARVLANLGREREAMQVCALGVARYPNDPEVLATSRQLGCP